LRSCNLVWVFMDSLSCIIVKDEEFLYAVVENVFTVSSNVSEEDKSETSERR